MGKMQRDKGKRWEQAVARDMRNIYGDKVHRGWQAREGNDAADVEGTPYWIECKHHIKVNIWGAMEQACKDTDGRIPLVAAKNDNVKPLAVMLWTDFLKMIGKKHG